MTLKICVAQLNLVVGDLSGNAQKIIASARAAYAQGARLVLTPELSICGYAAEDLFLRPAFVAACAAAVQTVTQALADLKGLAVVVGHPSGTDQRSPSVVVAQRYNQASVLCEGAVLARYAKRTLPNYQVFDEQRYFVGGQSSCVFELPQADGQAEGALKIGLLICEDAWFAPPARLSAQAGAELLVVINASPFHLGKSAEREACMRERVAECGLPLIYAHLVGGQDELVFEGRSFALNADGSLAARAPGFQEHTLCINVQRQTAALRLSGPIHPLAEPEADLWHALVLGLRDYVEKNGFPGVILGLSGGIDSALVLAIAVDALGKERVRAVMLPSPYTAAISPLDAQQMAARLGVHYQEISILPSLRAFRDSLAAAFAEQPSQPAEDSTEENIQARIRGTLLMALSNRLGGIVLTTGNKSEIAAGYCTLYGDMAGGFAVIKDVNKTTVFKLARWRNAHDPYHTGVNPIPERIITRPPSAELRPNQTDQDSLPDYAVLDAILTRYVEEDQSVEDIVNAGFARADVEKVTQLIWRSEYKRRQAAVGIRVTHRSFGKDWRYPITHRFRS